MWKNLLIVGWLAILSLCDIRKKSVPIWLLWLGAALAGGILVCGGEGEPIRILSVLRALIPGALLFLLAAGTGKAGCADGIILMILGVAGGYKNCLMICMGSLFLAALVSGVLLLTKRVTRNTKVPFVPFMTAGWLIMICGRGGVL
ncbi:MAG: hypothetical protein NC541_12605 [bacterium]|nr:hypothetical protein [bacterium]